jgi:O6-methylguanine-DNA--protein-cysteine methyltransferase
MDASFPRGGLEKLFAQYDNIRSHGRHEFAPSPIEPNPSPKNPPPADEPPWWSPDKMDEEAAATPATGPVPSPLEDGASGGFGKLAGSGLAIRAIQSQAGTTARGAVASLRSALPELAEPLLGEGAAATAAELAPGLALGAADLVPGLALGAMTHAGLARAERNQYKNSAVQPGEVSFEVDGKKVPAKTFHTPEAKTSPEPVTFRADEKGLDDAYMNPQGTSYDPTTKSMYIKGSSTATDWWDDVSKIPFGDTAQSERYGQAAAAYKKLNDNGKHVDRVVGHSLGGSVALELQKNLAKHGRNVDSRTFGAPVMDLKPFDRYYNKAERFRHPTDPVSILDRGASWGDWKTYPHSYAGFQNFDKSKDALKV